MHTHKNQVWKDLMGRQGLEEEEGKKSGFIWDSSWRQNFILLRPFLIGLEKDLCGFLFLLSGLRETLIDTSSSPIKKKWKKDFRNTKIKTKLVPYQGPCSRPMVKNREVIRHSLTHHRDVDNQLFVVLFCIFWRTLCWWWCLLLRRGRIVTSSHSLQNQVVLSWWK